MNDEIEAIASEIQEIESQKSQTRIPPVTDIELQPYVQDLQETLLKGSITERKGFIRTFIKEIRVDYPNIWIEYTDRKSVV